MNNDEIEKFNNLLCELFEDAEKRMKAGCVALSSRLFHNSEIPEYELIEEKSDDLV